MKKLLMLLLSVFLFSTGVFAQKKNFTIGTNYTVTPSGEEYKEMNLYNISLEKEVMTANAFLEDGEVVNTMYRIKSFDVQDYGDNFVYRIKVNGSDQELNLTVLVPKKGEKVFFYIEDTMLYGKIKNLGISE